MNGEKLLASSGRLGKVGFGGACDWALRNGICRTSEDRSPRGPRVIAGVEKENGWLLDELPGKMPGPRKDDGELGLEEIGSTSISLVTSSSRAREVLGDSRREPWPPLLDTGVAMDTGGLPAGKLVTMGSDAMGAETGSAAEVAGGLDEEAMLIEVKLRNQCKLQQVAWDKRDDCQVEIVLVTV